MRHERHTDALRERAGVTVPASAIASRAAESTTSGTACVAIASTNAATAITITTAAAINTAVCAAVTTTSHAASATTNCTALTATHYAATFGAISSAATSCDAAFRAYHGRGAGRTCQLVLDHVPAWLRSGQWQSAVVRVGAR